ncbi:organic solute transporter Ostalpha-domain-containing protein [Usnea florida]
MALNFTGINVHATIDTAEDTCVISPYFNKTDAYAGGYTYQQIILIISAVATTLCLIFSVSLASVHLSTWVKPKEQKQLVRIIIFPPIAGAFNLFSLWFYDASWILEPFPELYECFALVAMFYLLVLYVAPHESHREDFFLNLERYGVFKNKPKHDRGSLRWFRLIWVMVFQILPAKLILNILVWTLGSVECPLKFKLSRTATALSVIESIATSICVLGIVWFARRMAPDLKPHQVVYKLLSFKGIVGITLTQAPVFQLFAQYQWFKRTDYVSVFDFAVGTPAFMTCVEMFAVSVIFLWSFSAQGYLDLSRELPRTRGLGGALVEVADVRDIFWGVWDAARISFWGARRTRRRTRGRDVADEDRDVESDGVVRRDRGESAMEDRNSRGEGLEMT